jgi:hypothetical protein
MRALVVLVSLLVALPSGALSADDFTELTFRIQGPGSATVGQPTRLGFQLSNASGGSVLAHRLIDPREGFIKVFISFEGGPFKRFTDRTWGTKERMLSAETVGSGQTIESAALLLANHHVLGDEDSLDTPLAFASPGRYRVKARFYDLDYSRFLESNTITLQVSAAP